MKVAREQTEVLLMEYASGALDQACALLVASYITLCPEARRYLRHCESLGGTLMEVHCTPVAMHPDSLQAVLERLEHRKAHPAHTPPAPTPFCNHHKLPAPIARHINSSCSGARWRLYSRGVHYCILSSVSGGHKALLVRMAPGAATLSQPHADTEMTLVLEGSFGDESGYYKAGDLLVEEGTARRHRLLAGPDGCLCITVMDAPLRFSSGLYRLLSFLRF